MNERYYSTEILPGRLWAGSIMSVANHAHMAELHLRGLECVVHILPIGRLGGWSPDMTSLRVRAQRVLYAWDDTPLEPLWIDYAINLNMPTLIHCNAGKNRSTAIAACWLLRNAGSRYADAKDSAAAALREVIDKRELDRRTPDKLSPEMRENVLKYGAWLKGLKREQPQLERSF